MLYLLEISGCQKTGDCGDWEKNHLLEKSDCFEREVFPNVFYSREYIEKSIIFDEVFILLKYSCYYHDVLLIIKVIFASNLFPTRLVL